ncbi:MAG: phosphate signaling complex protein PhoU [Chitinispirillaceae bacterium]|nr:phosphate signaling complex protein PhoU [Chitinispirillaceae bacterium]
MVDVMQRTATIEISKDQLSRMAELVKKAVERSLNALFTPDILLAQEVIGADKAINSYEIDVDNSTFNLLTASNIPPELLRAIVSFQKVNAMLERIGDHAVNIAESAITIAVQEREQDLFGLPEMGKQCTGVLKDALESFFKKDASLAEKVLTRDDSIDAMNVGIAGEVKAKVLAGELSFETGLEIIRISRNLERVADLSANIAEETSFMVLGRVVKHHHD